MQKRIVYENAKVKRKVSIPVALDRDGNLVDAAVARKRVDYYCKFCGVILHKKELEGTAFYAKLPGTEHGHLICQGIERNGKYYSFMDGDEPEGVIGKLLHEPKTTGGGGGNGGGGHGDGDNGGDIDLNNGGIKVKVLPFRNLLQVLKYAEAVRNPYERIGNFRLKDFFLHKTWMRKFIIKLIELGARIVHVRYEFCDLPSLSLVFNNFWYNKDANTVDYQVKFRVTYLKRDVLEKHRRDLHPRKMDDNSFKMVSVKKREALLASPNWERVPRRECEVICKANNAANCQNCCGMYSTEYYSKKQVVVLPEEK